MKFLFLAMTLISLTLCPTQAWAENCYNTALTQNGMHRCADEHAKKANEELLSAMIELESKVTKEQANQLQLAKKSWEEYRDSYCEFEGSGVKGGSAYPMVILQCKTYLTNQYIELLKRQLNCQEGNLSCVTHN